MQVSAIRKKSLITAIKTPFDQQGKIDLKAYDYLVEQQLKAGVDGLVVGGTTGEGHLLDWEEHLMLIAHTASKYGDRLLVIGNTGSNNTREAVKATEYGFASGMHAALQINPYYGKTTQQGVQKHLETVLAIGPAFIYNVEGRTGQDIEPFVMENLAKHQNFVGVKECAGNERIKYYEERGIACWSGNDDESFAGRHQYGSHGVISVTSNIVPALMRRLMDENQEALNQQLVPLMQWLFCEPNPICINTALAMTGAVQPVFRLPYLPLDQEKRQQGVSILNELEPSSAVGNQIQSLSDEDFTVLV
ncbi:4-hydroxy-tetrahydrodipicolinate synthase [Aliikangiella coralliicola]|uniref:4-hydroxy-tetrahydrodipicolinate synthase n=1 Tax=Aliikangiella coralliicola TaxID=2592383 RepID=A0A545UD63_9GAMM|nr:4-hydroxy-tetrahydrodipicolinate synthase [Aliikangiella coralliicola]TQV87402.1 4-hydroxy-tetrahydrodipicolinate synthase [Aliikangiella coralliicola]